MIQKLRYTILFLLLIPFLTAFAQTAPKYEIRAAWLTTLGGMDWPSAKAVSASGIKKQQEELCHILDELQQANFNTVLFQTRLRGDVIYPSQFESFAESLTGTEGKNPGYDPLRFAIEECHKRGMELHAWIVAIPIGNTRQVRTLGKNALTRKHPSLCKQFNGSWYLDPGNPETDDYLANIIREIVSGYDVDGIHLDYIRYPEQGERFPDQSTYRKYGKKQDLKQWRRNNITRIVRRIYTETKSLKPWVKVSSSPIGKYRDTGRYSSQGWNAYDEVYQDAQQWLREGIHDALFPMMYFRGNHFYPFALDWKENKNGRWIVPGLGIYFLHPSELDWKLDEVVRQIYFIRSIGLDGQAYFRTRFLTDNTKGIFDEIKQHFYPLPAVVPPMTWTDSIAPSTPTNPVFISPERGVHLQWTASTDNLSPVYYRVYASDTYPVDTHNPANLIEARTDSTHYTYVPEVPWQEYLYWAVTAVDRCGNESEPLEFF
ncbi:family 10 glycosylhydrolase [uncultured Phocaeicola sp.]|uniref:glycoside hydrolase family 10 protein n=1 Tax=uncultured Phocaeicola sp. TaxID=990718 RepID=UPI0025FBB0FA|nr:family 10 glycosylhydrolase [uncultured Phocaeicola sp.]